MVFNLRTIFSTSPSFIYFVFNSGPPVAESLMRISAQALRRQVDQERCKQNFEFCIQSRFRMQSYSSSASQIGYRACGKEKVINMRWIPEQPLTRRQGGGKRLREQKRQEEGKVKCFTARRLVGVGGTLNKIIIYTHRYL